MRRYELLEPTSTFVGLANYRSLLADAEFRHAVLFTLGYAFAATTVELVLGFLIARLLADSRVGVRFSSGIRVALLLPYIAAPVVMAFMFKTLVFDPSFGYLNAILKALGAPAFLAFDGSVKPVVTVVLVDILLRTPFVVLIVYAGLMGVNPDIHEAAQIDGANGWQHMRHILVPIIRPVLLVAFTFRFLDAVKVFDEIYVLTQGGPGTLTESISVYATNQAFTGFHLGYATAATVIFTVLALAITVGLTRSKAFR